MAVKEERPQVLMLTAEKVEQRRSMMLPKSAGRELLARLVGHHPKMLALQMLAQAVALAVALVVDAPVNRRAEPAYMVVVALVARIPVGQKYTRAAPEETDLYLLNTATCKHCASVAFYAKEETVCLYKTEA
jgi:hypothetical protein